MRGKKTKLCLALFEITASYYNILLYEFVVVLSGKGREGYVNNKEMKKKDKNV